MLMLLLYRCHCCCILLGVNYYLSHLFSARLKRSVFFLQGELQFCSTAKGFIFVSLHYVLLMFFNKSGLF